MVALPPYLCRAGNGLTCTRTRARARSADRDRLAAARNRLTLLATAWLPQPSLTTGRQAGGRATRGYSGARRLHTSSQAACAAYPPCRAWAPPSTP
eukprot:818563-Prymnesium_polylepis.1